MARTNRQRILEYLRSIAPRRASNSDIRVATGVEPHQQVFQITQRLRQTGVIQAARRGHEWEFWIESPLRKPTDQPARPSPPKALRPAAKCGGLDPAAFEDLARSAMSIHLGVPLTSGEVFGVPKEFDMVSPDKSIVGDAKYYTLVHGKRLPPAKFATISEHVWLLEKTGARTKFLVFGNQREVPVLWLQRYGDLASRVDFYFLTDDGELEKIAATVNSEG